MKQYIGFSNDHSGSMGSLVKAAARDYNENIASIQSASQLNNLDTIVNVVQCGIRIGGYTKVHRQIVNSNVAALKPITNYEANGNDTPLFDSVGELIDLLKSVPDANDPEVSFLLLITTDGGENSSKRWSGPSLSAEIRRLQATDRWTFVFRVPRGNTGHLTRLGIPAGNIQEWDQTTRGVEVSTAQTTAAFNDYYENRSRGVKSSSTFYSNLKNVSAAEVKATLKDISGELVIWPVASYENTNEIRPFVEGRLKTPMLKGAAFYQLTKTESTVQDTKVIIIRDKSTGAVYYGPAARQLIGLPTSGNSRVVPGDHGTFEIYIQSTSVNRKLVGGTNVLYWPRVGIAFTEGPSYQPAASATKAQAALPVASPVSATLPTAAPIAAKKVAPTKATKFFVVRKKDGVTVAEVNSVTEAAELIAKAKRQKKAALVMVAA